MDPLKPLPPELAAMARAAHPIDSGQPKVGDWFISFILKCPCGRELIFAGQVGSERVCSPTDLNACSRVYRLSGMPMMTDRGELQVPLGMRFIR